MAATKTTTITALGGILVTDFDADVTPANNVTGNSSGTLYLVEVDNTANATTAAYFRCGCVYSDVCDSLGRGILSWLKCVVYDKQRRSKHRCPSERSYRSAHRFLGDL